MNNTSLKTSANVLAYKALIPGSEHFRWPTAWSGKEVREVSGAKEVSPWAGRSCGAPASMESDVRETPNVNEIIACYIAIEMKF